MVKIVPASVLLSQSCVTAALYDSYVGLSIELIGFPSFAGSKSSPNVYSSNLIQNLADAQGSTVVVRVGGNSGDRAIYDSTLSTPTASSCPHADTGAWQCIGTKFFESYGAFPQGTRYSHQFNLAAWNSSGFDTLKSTVPLACNALRGQLEFWEIGNEPDLYPNVRRPSSYSASQYAKEWTNMVQRFETLLHGSCPDVAQRIKYISPSLSSSGSKLRAADIFKAEGSAAQNVRQISVHNYMAGATQAGVTLQATLMNHTSVAKSIGAHVKYAKTVSNINADYILGEHNSLFGGGASGLSDVFGAALWAMEISLNAASTGIIKRVHFHQAVGSPYAAWQPIGAVDTKPPYYGKLAAATFLANSNTIKVQTIDLGGNKDLDSAYGAFVNGQLVRIAVLNLKEFSSGSRAQKRYTVKVAARSSWVVKRLTAGSAHDKSGVTFNGYSYGAESQGKPTRVNGRDSNGTIQADGNGNLVVTVADSEAVVLVRK